MRPLLRESKIINTAWWLNVKILISFYGENLQIVALNEMQFCTFKDHGHTYKFYLNHYFF
jgi:hypothetical protein